MQKYTEVTFELFEDAIRALYGQDGPEQQRLANEYLVHVWNHCKQSWEYGLRVLVRPVTPGQGDPTQTQYFCANMLYAKIRQEWFSLTPAEHDAIQSQVELLLQHIRSGQLTFAPLVLKRICMAMTVLSLAMDGGCARCVADSTQHQLSPSPSSLLHVHVSLELLTSLVDETDDSYLPPSRKDALVLEITDASTHVFPFLGRLFDAIASHPSADTAASLRYSGLTCLRAWIKAAGFSLAKLFSSMPSVFHALLQALHHPQTAPGAVKEVVVCALILSDALEVNEYPPAPSKDAATSALTSALLASQPAIQHYLVHEPQAAHAVTTLITTLGEGELDWLVQGSTEAIALSELVLHLTSQPHRQIATLAFDVWLGIQDYPVASRHPSFQDAAFRRLLHVLVHQCAQTEDDDEDDVASFRQAATELFVAIHHLLKASFVADVAQVIGKTGATDTVVEAAMFALTVVGPELKQRLADDLPTQQVVLELCRALVFVHPIFTSAPAVVHVSAVFLGHLGPLINAQWSATNGSDTSLLDATLQYLCFGLSVRIASAAASKAINGLCASCTPLLGQRDTLISAVLSSLHANVGHLDKQDRQWVVEGVVRVACVAPWGRLALEQLLTSIFARMADPALQSTPSLLAVELHALSTVLRFLDAPSDAAGGPALTQQVVDWSWPHIARVASSVAPPADVIEGLCDVFTATLHAMKHTPAFATTSEFSSMLSWVEQQAVASPAAIQCATVAVELYGATSTPPPSVVHVVMAVGHHVMAHCQAVASPSQIPDLLRGYFELLQRALLFCPATVFPAVFASTLHLSIACLMDLNQREALRAVVVYVNHVVTKRDTPALISYQAIVDDALAAQKAPLWVALVALLTTKCPTTVLPTVIHLAFGLLTTYGPGMHSAVADALAATDSPLSVEDRQRVYLALLRYTTNYEERKFTAFVKDYAKVCRKELPVEHLVDHFVAE